jgi:hypothetical protein
MEQPIGKERELSPHFRAGLNSCKRTKNMGSGLQKEGWKQRVSERSKGYAVFVPSRNRVVVPAPQSR